jgi:predicted TPR repeat methyltransferase
MEGTRYDGIAAWYDETFRPSLSDAEIDALQRLLGRGEGRCLDLGCGTGVAAPTLTGLRDYPDMVGLRWRR